MIQGKHVYTLHGIMQRTAHDNIRMQRGIVTKPNLYNTPVTMKNGYYLPIKHMYTVRYMHDCLHVS